MLLSACRAQRACQSVLFARMTAPVGLCISLRLQSAMSGTETSGVAAHGLTGAPGAITGQQLTAASPWAPCRAQASRPWLMR